MFATAESGSPRAPLCCSELTYERLQRAKTEKDNSMATPARTQPESRLIVRRVSVNRSRDGRAALEATGRRINDNNVVKDMPRGEDTEVEVVFFQVDPGVKNDAQLDAEYEMHELVPADPFAVAAVNEDDPTFADKLSNCAHWKGVDGKYCSAAFYRDRDTRCVTVGHDNGKWGNYWWHAGVRKSA